MQTVEFPYAPPQATSPAVRGLHSSVAFPASDQSSPLCHRQSPLEWPVHWVHLCFCFLSCFILILGGKTEKRKDLGTVPCWKESPCHVHLLSWWVCLDALLCPLTTMASGLCPGQAVGQRTHRLSVQLYTVVKCTFPQFRLQGSAVPTWAADSPLISAKTTRLGPPRTHRVEQGMGWPLELGGETSLCFRIDALLSLAGFLHSLPPMLL